MKRFRLEESETQIMSHSRREKALTQHDHRHSFSERVFECKTCSRKFASFQALGGHRASHKKPRLTEDGGGELSLAKPKMHECSICGLEFTIAQALGGHMRCHRAVAASLVEKKNAEEEEEEKRGLWLDLNLPPSEDHEEMECLRFGLTFHQFMETGPIVVGGACV